MLFSRASLAVVAILAATPLDALASHSFSTGSINKTRDYQVKWSREWHDSTTSFCTSWHSECKQYITTLVGALKYEIDCVFDQPGPIVYAWCGGELAVTPGVFADFTQNMMRFVHASMESGPAAVQATSTVVSLPSTKNNPATVVALKIAAAKDKEAKIRAKAKAAAKAALKAKIAAAKKAEAKAKALIKSKAAKAKALVKHPKTKSHRV